MVCGSDLFGWIPSREFVIRVFPEPRGPTTSTFFAPILQSVVPIGYKVRTFQNMMSNNILYH